MTQPSVGEIGTQSPVDNRNVFRTLLKCGLAVGVSDFLFASVSNGLMQHRTVEEICQVSGRAFVEAAYFTHEEEARKRESSDEFAAPQEDDSDLFGELTFTDLRRLQLT